MRGYVNRHLDNLRAAGLCRDCRRPSVRVRCFECRRIHAIKQAVRDQARRQAPEGEIHGL